MKDGQGNPVCKCTSKFTGKQCEKVVCPELQVACNKKCELITKFCDMKYSCGYSAREVQKYCGDCTTNDFCVNGGLCTFDKNGFRVCLCPFAFTGRQCKTGNDPNNCTGQNPPLQPCSSSCASQEVICNRSRSCGYPDEQIDFSCGACFDQYCLHGGSCSQKEDGTKACKCVGHRSGDRCQIQLLPTPGRLNATPGKSKSSMYIGLGVAAGIVLIIVVLVVAYLVMKSKRKKLTLFSVFYDPTTKDASKIRKTKGEIELAEGVGNPVYDTFNEGQPLENFHVSDVDTNMFATDDAFGISSDQGGATSMANPLYQDPYLEEDL